MWAMQDGGHDTQPVDLGPAPVCSSVCPPCSLTLAGPVWRGPWRVELVGWLATLPATYHTWSPACEATHHPPHLTPGL
jgi:hypothetical protein